MIALFLFVLSSGSLFIIFRGMGKDKDPLQVITWNYFFCTAFSFLNFTLNAPESSENQAEFSPWMIAALGLGVLFLINFSLTGESVRRCGLSVTAIAGKLSLVLPFGFTHFQSGNLPSIIPLTGLLLCLPAIYLSAARNSSADKSNQNAIWWLPFLVFAGTGLTDILTQVLNKDLLKPGDPEFFVLLVFFGALLSALVVCFKRYFSGELDFRWSNVLSGFALGLPNFISYKSILAALEAFHHQGNVVFPVANLGVILFSSLASLLYFRDFLSFRNRIGILFSVVSLLLLLSS